MVLHIITHSYLYSKYTYTFLKILNVCVRAYAHVSRRVDDVRVGGCAHVCSCLHRIANISKLDFLQIRF